MGILINFWRWDEVGGGFNVNDDDEEEKDKSDDDFDSNFCCDLVVKYMVLFSDLVIEIL